MHLFKLYPSNNKHMLNKDLTRFLQSLSFLLWSLTLSFPESVMESVTVVLTFESVDDFL